MRLHYPDMIVYVYNPNIQEIWARQGVQDQAGLPYYDPISKWLNWFQAHLGPL